MNAIWKGRGRGRRFKITIFLFVTFRAQLKLVWLVDFGPAQAIGRNLPWSPYIHICNILVITELAVNALIAAMYYKCRLKCSLRPIITPEY